jgi:glycosyltransferase involved in cell wall biosynthesis
MLVSHGYPPFGLAGVERVTEQTALALVQAGHEVTVMTRRVTPVPRLPVIERSTRSGVEIVRIDGGGITPDGPFPGHQSRLDRIFERLLLELMPDVVVIGHLMAHSSEYVAIAHRWGIPVVLELHDFYTVCERAHLERPSGELCQGPDGGRACARHCFADQESAEGRWALRTHLFNVALTNADALVCPSQFVADYFQQQGPSSEKVRVIPNDISFAPSTATTGTVTTWTAEQPLHFASLGVATPHKGQHVVVEALRKARLSEVRYSLFGALTQPYAHQLREAAQRIDHLELRTYGVYEPASLPMLLADVDAVIIPSLVWETFSIVAREAMACGVPVIASRIGALPEAVREGENGLLFAAGSSAELAVLLSALDADRMKLGRLRAGIRWTDWTSASDRTSRLTAVLGEVCSAGVRQGTTDVERHETGALRALFGA